MQDLEKTVKEKIDEIKEKISKNKGQVIFCSRELEVPGEVTGDFIPPKDKDYHHYEIGILEGEMKFIEKSDMQNISLPTFLHIGVRDIYYSHFKDLEIPVHRKLSGFYISSRFQFNVKNLEHLADGKIFVGIQESNKYYTYNLMGSLFKFYERKPELKNFALLIGDEEVEKFLKEKKIENPNELFDVLTKPELVRERINKHYYNKREELGKNLLISANKITNSFREIKALENNVMRACLIRERDQYGSLICYWDKPEVDKYEVLRRKILKDRDIIIEQLEKGEKLYISTSRPLINGEIIGFPEKTTFNHYETWLKNSLIPDIEKTFNKIDSYLNEQKKG